MNGNSGHFPARYEDLIERERDFPSEAALDYLRTHGVNYVTVHGSFMDPEAFDRTVTALDQRPDLSLVVAAAREGSESRLYRLRKGLWSVRKRTPEAPTGQNPGRTTPENLEFSTQP